MATPPSISASATSAGRRSLTPTGYGRSWRSSDPPPDNRGSERPMAKRIVIHEHGGPEVLKVESYEPSAPGPGEALIRQTAIGLNFIDSYFRTGLYPPPGGLPCTLGN